MNYKELTFPEYCGAIYTEEYNKTLNIEVEKPEKMAREAFIDPSHRAKSMSYYADIRKNRFEAYTMLIHGKDEHGEEFNQIESNLFADMPESDVEAATYYASKRGFWLN
ncbi:MAG: hypothetical protein ACYS5V_13965 [Planctomycetota bacterium]|jgi:hypothetical protein